MDDRQWSVSQPKWPYVGDDVPDIRAMMEVGLPACPADACPDVKAYCRYISPAEGGYGNGRDILEQILRKRPLDVRR